MELRHILMIISLWVLAIGGTIVMRKLDPENKVYPVYACVLAAFFTVYMIFQYIGIE